MSRFPREILHLTIRLALGPGAGRRKALGFMCVCKAWQDAALDLLYEDVLIDTLTRLRLFEQRILDGTRTRSYRSLDVRRLVRQLELVGLDVRTRPAQGTEPFDTVISSMSSMTTILLHLTHLRHFTCRTCDLWQPYKLAFITNFSQRKFGSSWLTSLRIMIRWDDHDTFAAINTLIHLKKITVEFDGPSHQYERRSLDSHHGLCLPLIKEVIWVIRGTFIPDMILLLAACMFGKRCSVKLHVDVMPEQDAHLLIPFFTWNTPREFVFSGRLDLPEIWAAHIAKIETVIIESPIPALELARQEALPQHLHLRLRSSVHSESHLWAFLNELITRAVPSSCALYIYRDGARFDWLAGEKDPLYAQFVGRLLPLAIRLDQMGIQIVDRHGADYSTLSSLRHRLR